MSVVKKTPTFEKLEKLAERIPRPISWLIPDPYNPASYVMPITGLAKMIKGRPMIIKGGLPKYRTPGTPTTEQIKVWRQEMVEQGFDRKEVNEAIGQSLKRGVNPVASDDLYSLGDYLDALDALIRGGK